MNENEIVNRAMEIEGATFPEEVRYVYQLARQGIHETFFVELGTYQGRTLSAIAHAANETKSIVVSIDNYQYDEPGSFSSSVEIVQNNLTIAGVPTHMDVRYVDGDSRIVPDFVDVVGFLFVDSTHTRAHFNAEMEVWLPHVVPGGIIACHDYESPTWLEMTGVIKAWFDNKRFKYLGLGRRVIGYRKN